MKKAFSLIEVIFVLVILGIVASISSQIIVQVYENYIVQNAIYRSTTKTELATTQIVNRLTYAIKGTTIAKDTIHTGIVEGTNWIKLKDIPKADNNFTTIEWIGYDNDSFTAGATPYWSGIANYETASSSSLETPGSTLSNAATIMNNMTDGKVTLADANHAAGVIFMQKDNLYRTGEYYSPACMGLIDNNTSCIFSAFRNGDNNLTFPDALPKIVTERYKLAYSAYALVPEKDTKGDYNLMLYSNYQPWNNERYTTGHKHLLINNVSVFKFTENGGVIQLKLCVKEHISTNSTISSCKEKAIIR